MIGLYIWAAILLIFCLFIAKILYNAYREDKRLEAIYRPVYSAEMPTKKQIQERNEINRLLDDDVVEEYIFKVRNEILYLDEHEKALA